MPSSSTTAISIGPKICKPFLLDVMVFSPESGFKFHVSVQLVCDPTTADSIWKLVFDLYKVVQGQPDVPLVQVAFTAGTPVEQQAVQQIVQGVAPAQADKLVSVVYPAAKDLVGNQDPTPEQKQALHDAMSGVVNVDV
jgi:hypothetical protein